MFEPYEELIIIIIGGKNKFVKNTALYSQVTKMPI